MLLEDGREGMEEAGEVGGWLHDEGRLEVPRSVIAVDSGSIRNVKFIAGPLSRERSFSSYRRSTKLNAPFGQFGMGTLVMSTKALKSRSRER